jgi:hypothetical protein
MFERNIFHAPGLKAKESAGQKAEALKVRTPRQRRVFRWLALRLVE